MTTTVAYSTDGIAWSQSILPVSDFWNAVSYNNGTFVAISRNNIVAYSTDGITWTQKTVEDDTDPRNVELDGVIAVPNVLGRNTQYTVPSKKQARISSIYIASNESVPNKYSVAIIPNGETLSNIHYIRRNVLININEFHIIDANITLAEGDQIVTEGSSIDISVNIFGSEK